MYNEDGDVAGVRSDPGSNEYFSEGVGYGMLLMVYFSDNTTSYQPQFDKIWNFYKKMMNENGLMVSLIPLFPLPLEKSEGHLIK